MHHCSHKMGSTIELKLAQTTTTSRPYIALAAGCNPFVGRLVRASAILVRRTWSDSMVHVMFLKYLEYVSDIFLHSRQVIDLGQLWTWKGKQTELGIPKKIKILNLNDHCTLLFLLTSRTLKVLIDWYTWEKFFQLTDAPNLILKRWIYLRWAESGNAVWEDSSMHFFSLSVLLGKLQGSINSCLHRTWEYFGLRQLHFQIGTRCKWDPRAVRAPYIRKRKTFHTWTGH